MLRSVRSGAVRTAALVLVLAGCSGSDGADEGAAPRPASASPSASAPPSASPSAATSASPSQGAAPSAGSTVVTEAGLRLAVPAGWQSTGLSPAAREQALAEQDDPRVAEFLRGRLDGLAANNAVLYLYDLRAVETGALATVEVYRYPAGRTPEQVVTDVVLPRLQAAGLNPTRGEADLPAGAALTVTARAEPGGQEVSNEQYVLPVGPTTVSLSATAVGRPSEGIPQILRSLRAG